MIVKVPTTTIKDVIYNIYILIYIRYNVIIRAHNL